MKVRTKDLVKAYRGRRVVDHVSLEFETGKITALLGPNGAGKTTTFYMIVGLVRPNSGHVFLESTESTELTKWPMYKRARAGIGYLPQEASVFRNLTVEENLRLVLELRGVSKTEQNKKIKELLGELGMLDFRSSKGRVLSGGERRRVEIARALASDPKFILLDEPFTGIDPRTIEELQSILLQLKERGIGILITDHNVGATLGITDWNYILIDGRISKEGDREAIVSDPDVKKHYLGEQFQ